MTNKQLAPARPLESLHHEVDRLFGSFFDDFSFPKLGFKNGALVPKIDFKATDEAYQLDVELPGIPPSEIQVSVTNGILSVKGEKRAGKEEKDKNYIRIERSYGSFERSLSLPDDADDSKIAASSRDGVLTITLPKREGAAAQARKIEVKAA